MKSVYHRPGNAGEPDLNCARVPFGAGTFPVAMSSIIYVKPSRMISCMKHRPWGYVLEAPSCSTVTSELLDGADEHFFDVNTNKHSHDIPFDYVSKHKTIFSMSSSRFAPYRNALAAISTRTGSPLPSLIFSFAVLHELTAIVPLVGIFYTARGFQVGERVVNQFMRDDGPDAGPPAGWVTSQLSQWVDEGERWANRVGRRYGVFGFEKGAPADHGDSHHLSGQLAGDVANAILAYGATKVRSLAISTILT